MAAKEYIYIILDRSPPHFKFFFFVKCQPNIYFFFCYGNVNICELRE